MDIALIMGVVFGFVCMIGSIAYIFLLKAHGVGNFVCTSFELFLEVVLLFVAFPMPHVALSKAIDAVLKPADDKMGPLVDEAVK